MIAAPGRFRARATVMRPGSPSRRPAASIASVGVLDDVGQRLRDQAMVDARHDRLVRAAPAVKRMFGLPTSCRNTASRTTSSQVTVLHDRLRHAREAGELVHHAADVADLADDRLGALVEDLPVLRPDMLAEPPLQPLRRELDRRQRVLDLMGDAARHVRPGGAALRRHQVGDVVERDDQALDPAGGALLRDLDVEGARLAVAHQLDLRVGRAADPLPGLLEHHREAPGWPRSSCCPTRSLSSMPSAASADRLTSVTRAAPSRPITPAETPDSTASVKRRRSSILSLAASSSVALRLQLARHGVEGGGERADVAGRAARRHVHVEIAGRDLLRRADQPCGSAKPGCGRSRGRSRSPRAARPAPCRRRGWRRRPERRTGSPAAAGIRRRSPPSGADSGVTRGSIGRAR